MIVGAHLAAGWLGRRTGRRSLCRLTGVHLGVLVTVARDAVVPAPLGRAGASRHWLVSVPLVALHSCHAIGVIITVALA